ncbi:MAG: DUF1731 domain-containing protein [Proteobacteria bacterium]|uniref:DUF1731 domain-containing protein n=1 Tax=Candidatus Avisuccinivibrio stercorigallinarum TaxID=2840704 RepID=A0A9D9DD97_9GAMM|nr:DUF1731 domain-containing protein [Candidatus Avisuccinivibrio stercorigallinarum]
MHYIIAGASGLVGQALLRELQQHSQDSSDHHPDAADLKITLLSRSEAKLNKLKSRFADLTAQGFTYRQLQEIIKKTPAPAPDNPHPVLDLNGAVFINLAGESIAKKRLGNARLQELLSSRLAVINLCQELIKAGCGTPALFVQAGSLSILRDDDIEQDGSETAGHAIAGILKQLEAAVRELPCPALILRLPIVLSENALFCRLLRTLPPIALLDGSNYLPAASVRDCARALLFSAEHHLTGAINVSPPSYFTARALLKAAAGEHRLLPPMPVLRLMLRLAALFDLRALLLLENKKVRAQRLTGLGFKFEHLTLEACLSSH